MIAAVGHDVRIVMEGKKKILSPRGELLHDEKGRDWPACSGLIVSFKKTREKLSTEHLDGAVKKHFGKEYIVRRGTVRLPPMSLSAWNFVGHAKEIRYTRRGEFADLYFHPFEEKNLPKVYRRGSAIRIELGSGCAWSWRGFVKP